MGKREVGLRRRGSIWWIEKQIKGRRIRESTGACDYDEARRYLAFRMDQLRRTEIYGDRPDRTFEQAAARYLIENCHKRSIQRDDQALRTVMPIIGDLELADIHYGKLQKFVEERLAAGIAPSTVNRDLVPVRQVLKAAATRWFHENGRPWLTAVPEIPRLKTSTVSKARSISFTEQKLLLQALPTYLADMVLFAVNSGCRRGELMALRWSWEVAGMPVFEIPAEYHKTGASMGSRLVICNSTAWSVVNDQRGRHREFVFSRDGKPVKTFHGRAWRKARKQVGLQQVRPHDLRHTFATRLAASGVNEADIGLLLGHVSRRITTRYIAPDIERLLLETEKIVRMKREPVLRVVG